MIAHLAMALFVLVQLTGNLAPLLPLQQAQPVCSAHDGTIRWVLEDGTELGDVSGQTHGMQCVLCVPVGGPPSTTRCVAQWFERPEPWQLFIGADAPVRRLAWPPLLARGPPLFS